MSLNQYAAARLATAVSITTAIAIVGTVVFSPGSLTPKREVAATGTDALDPALVGAIRELRATWDPRARRRVLDGFAERGAHLADALDRLLHRDDHDWHVEGIELAAALRDPELRDSVASLAGASDDRVRKHAVLAVERIEPWSAAELTELLGRQDPTVCIATLDVCRKRSDAPWSRLVQLIASEDTAVRDAALAAIGPGAPPEAASALWDLVDRAEESLAAAALDAIARIELDETGIARLGELAERPEPRLRYAAVEALAARTGSEVAADRLVRVLDDASAPSDLRSRALLAIEQVGVIDAEAIESAAFFLDPKARYFAARCLLTADRPQGTELLLGLVDSEDGDAAIAARQLLGWLTGRGPTGRADEFARALAQPGTSLARRTLPPPGLEP